MGIVPANEASLSVSGLRKTLLWKILLLWLRKTLEIVVIGPEKVILVLISVKLVEFWLVRFLFIHALGNSVCGYFCLAYPFVVLTVGRNVSLNIFFNSEPTMGGFVCHANKFTPSVISTNTFV